MPIDILIILVLPVLMMALVLVLAFATKPSQPGQGFLHIGLKRVAFGYAGALVAIFLYFIGMHGAEGVGFFFVTAPSVIVMLTLIGLPLFALLSKLGWLSLVGVTLIGVFYAVVLYWVSWIVFEDDDWLRQWFDVVLPILVALGFGLGARLPLVKETQPTTS